MQKAKFFAAVAVLALAGAVYAGGNLQESASQAQAAKAVKASCCAAHKGEQQGEGHHAHAAMSCDKDGKGCCGGGQGCCAGGGGSCCAGGSCEKPKKGEAAAVKVSATAEGESCCAPGAACCQGDGQACCAAHKGEAKSASAATKEGESCCAGCGSGCCSTHKVAGR
jgi:hypothetical protein